MNPTVLYFHHIGEGVDHYTSVTLGLFERMLDLLQDRGVFVDLADPPAQDDSPRFVLTFDDGYEAVFERPLEVLLERGIPATFFVVPAWFGRRAEHPWATTDLRYADAATLRSAEQRGFRIASHTWSHRALDALSSDEVKLEVARARAALDIEGLGLGCRGLVAYPYGRVPSLVPLVVTAGFATGRQPTACWSCRPSAITRVYLSADDDYEGWSDRIDGWLDDAQQARDQCDYSDHRAVGLRL